MRAGGDHGAAIEAAVTVLDDVRPAVAPATAQERHMSEEPAADAASSCEFNGRLLSGAENLVQAFEHLH